MAQVTKPVEGNVSDAVSQKAQEACQNFSSAYQKAMGAKESFPKSGNLYMDGKTGHIFAVSTKSVNNKTVIGPDAGTKILTEYTIIDLTQQSEAQVVRTASEIFSGKNGYVQVGKFATAQDIEDPRIAREPFEQLPKNVQMSQGTIDTFDGKKLKYAIEIDIDSLAGKSQTHFNPFAMNYVRGEGTP